jgi:hypothetical protein
MLILRRFLVLGALLYWQGGFTFYAAVVVPIGTAQLGSSRRQGFITRRVTRDLNLTGAVALLPLAWDLFAARDPSTRRRRVRAYLWLSLVATQAALFYLHAYLDGLLQVRGGIVLDPERFRPAHRTYLWISTLQWGCALLFLLLSLIGWRTQDGRKVGMREEQKEQGRWDVEGEKKVPPLATSASPSHRDSLAAEQGE